MTVITNILVHANPAFLKSIHAQCSPFTKDKDVADLLQPDNAAITIVLGLIDFNIIHYA